MVRRKRTKGKDERMNKIVRSESQAVEEKVLRV